MYRMANLKYSSTCRKFVLLLVVCVICLSVQFGVIHDIAMTGIFLQKTTTSSATQFRLSKRPTDTNTNATEYRNEAFPYWEENKRNALSVFIFSAILTNRTGIKNKQILKINAWEALKHRRKQIKCCYLWKENRISSYSFPNKTYWRYPTILSATQFNCLLRSDHVFGLQGVTMQFNELKCPGNLTGYVKPVIAMKQKTNSLAVCGKIVYGNIDAKLLIEWVEYYREMKVDKIVLFTYNINEKANKVLQFYAKSGFVEINRFDLPWKYSKTLKRDVGLKGSIAAFQDEQVVVFDCSDRLHGYTFIAIVDLDEFVLPKKHKNLKDMTKRLVKQYPFAAGFTFKVYIFPKEWGKVVATNGSVVTEYFNRTGDLFTREKNIFLPSRVRDGSVWTHDFGPMEGYKRIVVPVNLAVMHHYRKCYHNMKKHCKKKHQITDYSILKIVKRTQNRTRLLMQEFG